MVTIPIVDNAPARSELTVHELNYHTENFNNESVDKPSPKRCFLKKSNLLVSIVTSLVVSAIFSCVVLLIATTGNSRLHKREDESEGKSAGDKLLPVRVPELGGLYSKASADLPPFSFYKYILEVSSLTRKETETSLKLEWTLSPGPQPHAFLDQDKRDKGSFIVKKDATFDITTILNIDRYTTLPVDKPIIAPTDTTPVYLCIRKTDCRTMKSESICNKWRIGVGQIDTIRVNAIFSLRQGDRFQVTVNSAASSCIYQDPDINRLVVRIIR